MSAPIKTSDLKNIRNRELPLIQTVKSETPNQYIETFHIVDRIGDYYDRGYKKDVEMGVSRCGRVVRYWSTFSRDLIPLPSEADKLCSRCAKTRDDFQKVLEEYHRVRSEWNKESQARDLEKKRIQDAEWNANQDAIRSFLAEHSIEFQDVENMAINVVSGEWKFFFTAQRIETEVSHATP